MTVQIILKNSNVVDKRPAATQLANGELSLNYNEAGAFLCCVDSAGNVQQVGGVKITEDAPGTPVRGTMWLQPSSSTLFVYNGTGWLAIAGGGGGGGGGGDITSVLGGDGITTTQLSGVVTVNADLNTDQGLHIVAGEIAINPGANISFDAQGRLQAEASALAYRGTVDLVAGAVPVDPLQGDTHANVVSGVMSDVWRTATGEAPGTNVAAGDLVVWNGTIWTYIPTGGTGGQGTDLTVDGITATTLDIASSTGNDATVPAATTTDAGLMTAADKTKLDGVAAGAEANVQVDWNETDVDSDAFIQNKPDIPADQVQSNWDETDNTDPSFIRNKPTIPAAQVQSDWDQTDTLEPSFIVNKPTIPDAQVQSDWDEDDTNEVSFIQNKPFVIPEVANDGEQYVRRNGAWDQLNAVPEAPEDGNQYARQDGAWEVVQGGGGGGGVTRLLAGGNITLDPADGLGNVTITAAGGGDGAGTTTTELFGVAKAYGVVDAAGNVTGAFNCTVTRPEAGTYTVVFDEPEVDADYVVTFGREWRDGEADVAVFAEGKTINGFSVFTNRVGDAVSTSTPFDFTVHSNTPTLVQSTAGTAAWGSFSDLGVLGANLNIASVLRHPGNNTGWYDITFERPMPSAEYSVTISTGADNAVQSQVANKTANGFEILTRSDVAAGTLIDCACDFAVHALNSLPPTGTTGVDAWGVVDGGTGDPNGPGFNFTSTRTGVGVYEITFNNPMPNDDYSVVVTSNNTGTKGSVGAKTTDTVQIAMVDDGGNLANAGFNFQVCATNARIPFTVTQEQIEAAINNPGVSAWGRVNADGTMDSALNATCERIVIGQYRITFDRPMPNANYAVVMGQEQTLDYVTSQYQITDADGFDVFTFDAAFSQDDRPFSFTVLATNALPPRGGTGADAWAMVQQDQALNSSFNIDRVERTAAGQYTVFFTNPMPDDSYAVFGQIFTGVNADRILIGNARTAESFTVNTFDTSDQSTDMGFAVVVHATNAQLPDTVTQEQLDAVLNNWERVGTTLQPVNAGDNVTTTGTVTGNLLPTNGQLAGFRNKVINGDFRVRQRFTGTAEVNFPAGTGYVMDRWYYDSPSDGVGITQADSAVLQFAVIRRIGGNDESRFGQIIEDIRPLMQSGATDSVTLSFIAQRMAVDSNTTNLRVFIETFNDSGFNSGALVDQAFVLTDNWTAYNTTFNLPDLGGQANGPCRLRIVFYNTGADGDFNTGISLVQLEPGAIPTPFESCPIGAELALCQRYFVDSDEAFTGHSPSPTATNRFAYTSFPTTMRITPTITVTASQNIQTTTVSPSRVGWQSVGGLDNSANFQIQTWTADAEL